MSADILPDSRLKSDKGSLMMDWPLGDGRFVRTEVVPVFCANCGKPNGYVPRDNTTWAFWLCQRCFDEHGLPAGLMAAPDDAFWESVQQEMLDRYGRILTEAELQRLAEQGWGPLANLAKDSPIKARF